MQDQPSTYSQTNPQFPEHEHEHLKCPRCDSLNTKFCYYNNYNLSQPRHFCKSCRRYWTKGGTLRNIPVGGGSRKNTKRSSNPKRSSNSTPQSARPKREEAASKLYRDDDPSAVEIGGSFGSLLEANGGQFGNVLAGLNSSGSAPMAMGEYADSGLGSTNLIRNSFQSSKNSESFPGVENGGDSSCWSTGTNGWPDLAIYTPGSSFL